MALPTIFSELCVEISCSNKYPYTFHVLSNMLTSEDKAFATGFAFTDNTRSGAQFTISLTKIRLSDYYYGGNKVDGANITVYYKI